MIMISKMDPRLSSLQGRGARRKAVCAVYCAGTRTSRHRRRTESIHVSRGDVRYCVCGSVGGGRPSSKCAGSAEPTNTPNAVARARRFHSGPTRQCCPGSCTCCACSRDKRGRRGAYGCASRTIHHNDAHRSVGRQPAKAFGADIAGLGGALDGVTCSGLLQ
jgi:hypothetical protein